MRDLVRPGHEPPITESIDDEVRVLIHRQNGHPVSDVVGEHKPPIHIPDSVRKWPSAGNNEQRDLTACKGNLGEDPVEVFRPCQQSTTDLYDDNKAQLEGR
jgi:hypothetical protein